MATTYALLYGYIAALANGKTSKQAVLQALIDADFALEYVDSLNVDSIVSFGSWFAAQI